MAATRSQKIGRNSLSKVIKRGGEQKMGILDQIKQLLGLGGDKPARPRPDEKDSSGEGE